MPRHLLAALTLGLVPALAAAGPLAPPAGPITPTHKTLTQLEPRTPVNSLPGASNAVHVISQPGSYYLTGDIVRQPNKMGILVAADHVTIDLGGFSLIGVNDNFHSTNIGISPSGARTNLTVRNGTIRGWGYATLGATCTDSLWEDLAVIDNTAGGLHIHGTHNSIFRNIRVRAASGEVGIETGNNSLVEGCVIDGPTDGINTLFNCAIVNCTVTGCAGAGIETFAHTSVTNCSVYDCARGIMMTSGGAVRGCSVTSCTVVGIEMGLGVTVLDSSIRFCPIGIRTRPNTAGHGRIEGNSLSNNGVGLQIDSPNNTVIRNTITGSTTAPAQIAPGNAAGALQASPAAAGPWDNIVF